MGLRLKLLVVSDTHLLEDGGEIIGLDPFARLRAVLEHAMRHHADAARLVVLGDLTHHGRPAQYARLRDALADVPVPVSLMLGNHDHRGSFLAQFPQAPVTESGHVQHVAEIGAHVLICLDTLDDDADPPHSGRLCAARLDWLRDTLAASAGRPVIVALHHPPFATGFSGMDAIRLVNGEAFFEVLTPHPNVVQLLCGHVHRTISGSVRGLPYAVFKSPCHQMPMMLGQPGTGHSVDEPGAYGIVLLGAEGITVHTEDVGLARGATLDPTSN